VIALIQHLWRENRAQIIERSRLNCHTTGLSSLMLLEAPGRTIRLFMADESHDLFENAPGAKNPMSIGFHPHHCNITLHVAWGEICNWTVLPTYGDAEMNLPRFKLRSALINGGKAGFVRDGACRLNTVDRRWLSHRTSVSMDARELHTVEVLKGNSAAWFVFEGRENTDYESLCFSPRALDQATFDHLYIKPTETQVENFVDSVLHMMRARY
jgi:hypothetical protein